MGKGGELRMGKGGELRIGKGGELMVGKARFMVGRKGDDYGWEKARFMVEKGKGKVEGYWCEKG